jgi:ketosteroid isomerase-like protein
MTEHRSIAEQIVADEQRIGRAISAGDATVVDALLADDFVGTTANGMVLTKQEVIESLFSPAYDIEAFENTDIDVRLHGDTAIVVARGIVRGRYNGENANGQFRYTRVWTRRHGRWLAVAAHSSMLPPMAATVSAGTPSK